MKKRHTNALGWLSVLLLVVAGTSCGGDDSGGGQTSAQKHDACLKKNSSVSQAKCFIDLSAELEGLADQAGAKKSRAAALEAAQKIDNPPEQIEAILKLAKAHLAADDPIGAKAAYSVINEEFEGVPPAQVARFRVRLAILKLDSDRRDGPDLAAEDLAAAEKLFDQITLAEDKVEVLSLMFDGYARVNDSEASQRVYDLLIKLPASVNDWSSKAQAMVAVAKAQRLVGNDAAAGLKTLGEARAIVDQIDAVANKDDRLKKAYRLYNLADGYIGAGKSDVARELLDAADGLAKTDPEGQTLVVDINKLRGKL